MRRQSKVERDELGWRELEKHYAGDIEEQRKALGGVGRMLSGRDLLARKGITPGRVGRLAKRQAKREAAAAARASAIPAAPSRWRQLRAEAPAGATSSAPATLSKRDAKLAAYPSRARSTRRRFSHGRR
jgi:beta-phosphoglucomutase-like phosphatase (HAD superfamily)